MQLPRASSRCSPPRSSPVLSSGPKITSFHLDLEGMGMRAATSVPVAAVSSVLFARSLPQTPLPTTAHCWGFPPWTRRRRTSAARQSSSSCFLERSREMGSSPTAGAAVLPDGLLPAVLGCISWWWQGFIGRSCKYR
ncbi:hypothetical protein VPH35_066180 [Triticum aestivum]|uniref:Uncharacterized protein n=1 Tax=Triticum turgidum subsp. durum TaxID=4567 RepID=A0A9R0VYM1_TRITD|nr:unnamed protein product [Triticum turgidum subsp. durum]